jgi:hypothetical protein
VANDRPNGGNCTVEATGAPATLGGNQYRVRCWGWEDRQSDPISYQIEAELDGVVMPLSYGKWWSPYAFVELLPSASEYYFTIHVTDATGHGTTAFSDIAPILSMGTLDSCPLRQAQALLDDTVAQQAKLDSARIVQRMLGVATLLKLPRDGCVAREPQCDAAASITGEAVAILTHLVRSEGSRARAEALAQTLAALLAPPVCYMASDDLFSEIMSQIETTIEWTLAAPASVSVASSDVTSSILLALDRLLVSRAPEFNTVAPSEAQSARVFAVLNQLAHVQRRDFAPGQRSSDAVARSPHFVLTTTWWEQSPFGMPPLASMVPSALYADDLNALLAPVGPQSNPRRALLSSTLFNFTLVPSPELAASWVVTYNVYNETGDLIHLAEERPATFSFAIDTLAACAAFRNGTWSTDSCAVSSSAATDTTMVCTCALVNEVPYAALWLRVLPNGDVSTLVPTPPRPLVPFIPALPAGLAIAALILVAIVVLLLVRYIRRRNNPTQLNYVSDAPTQGALVPGDNRFGISRSRPYAPLDAGPNGNDVPRDDDFGLPIDLAAVRVFDAKGAGVSGGGPTRPVAEVPEQWESIDDEGDDDDFTSLLGSADFDPSM